MDNYRKLTREHAEITPVVGLYREYCQAWKTGHRPRAPRRPGDEGTRRGRTRRRPGRPGRIDAELQTALLPRDPNDERNLFLEIRAGTGGDEAACSPATCCA